jgi:hypothetical protein
MVYKFRGIPGPKNPDGTPAQPLNPTGVSVQVAAEPPPQP